MSASPNSSNLSAGASTSVTVDPDNCTTAGTTTGTITVTGAGETITVNVTRNCTVASPTRYFLFDSETQSRGNIGGRAGADQICANDNDRPAVCTNYAWAFITVSFNDEIRDFPDNIPNRSGGVPWNSTANWYFRDYRHHGVRAANSWRDLLDGTVDNRPDNGGFDGSYWTGSMPGGGLSNTCRGWSSSFIADYGVSGIRDHRDSHWLTHTEWHTTLICSLNRRVLCACF